MEVFRGLEWNGKLNAMWKFDWDCQPRLKGWIDKMETIKKTHRQMGVVYAWGKGKCDGGETGDR